uniref:Uncharacterized protein n=1 Tax=Trichogramma kaykai TaxID=54128 RepID=A0ABD2WI49_9HYME
MCRLIRLPRVSVKRVSRAELVKSNRHILTRAYVARGVLLPQPGAVEKWPNEREKKEKKKKKGTNRRRRRRERELVKICRAINHNISSFSVRPEKRGGGYICHTDTALPAVHSPSSKVRVSHRLAGAHEDNRRKKRKQRRVFIVVSC